MARDLTPFYSRGMQVLTRTESSSGKLKTPWRADPEICSVMEFYQNEIVRTTKKEVKYAMGRNYHTLTFKCTFPGVEMISPDEVKEPSSADQSAPGTVFCFAYGLPLTYTDLLGDLENAKKFLLANGGYILSQSKQPPLQTIRF